MKKPLFRRVFLPILLGLVGLGLVVWLLFEFTPYPTAYITRYYFDKEAVRVNEELVSFVPSGVMGRTDLVYNENDKDATLDIYFPQEVIDEDEKLPLVVWVHGGAYISGDKDQIANYCKILASKGFAVASVNYSIAPGKTYPTPIKQIMSALAFLSENKGNLPIDTSRIFLAGDSAGAHSVVQIATIVTSPDYAKLINISPTISEAALQGLVLYCGPYDVKGVDLEGKAGGFFTTVLWAYSGIKHFKEDEYFMTSNIIEYITADFPPSFISVGNADFLASHSYKLAEKLESAGVQLDTLFFPDNYQPPLNHEYQFNLQTEAGKKALEESIKFLIKQTSISR